MQKETEDPLNPLQIWNWEYLPNGSLCKTTDPLNNLTRFEYNSNNWLIQQTDAEGRKWQYIYDELGRISVLVDPLLQDSETRTYTENGHLATISDANDNQIQHEYDRFDRLNKRIYPDLTFEQNSLYDDNGNVLSMITRAGDEIASTFDVLNRSRTRQPETLALQTMTYDLAGRLMNINTPANPEDPTTGDYGFGYDTAGRLVSQSMPDSKTVSYELDKNGNRTKLTYPDGYCAQYLFDELNRMTDIRLNGSSSSAIHFDYDALSRRVLITYENGCTCTYSWNLSNDLEQQQHVFEDDSVGFLLTYNKVHQPISTSASNKKYNWTPASSNTKIYSIANNLNQYPKIGNTLLTYNTNGCLTDGPFLATFDTLNRLTQLVTDDVSNDYIYDPKNRQARKTSNASQTNFLYDGAQLIEQYDQDGVLVNRFVPGPLADETLISIKDTTKSYLHLDRLSSVIARTDGAGLVLNRYKYGVFGETTSLPGATFGYTGQRYDPEVSLYNYKARIYSPALGRFLQPDPTNTVSGDLNLYTYVKNDPVAFSDPTGLQQSSNTNYSTIQAIGSPAFGVQQLRHAGTVVQVDGTYYTINGFFALDFRTIGRVSVDIRTSSSRPDIPMVHPSSIPLFNWTAGYTQGAISIPHDQAAQIVNDAYKMQALLRDNPKFYNPWPGVLGPGDHATSNQVLFNLTRGVDLWPGGLAPGYNLPPFGLPTKKRTNGTIWNELRNYCK